GEVLIAEFGKGAVIGEVALVDKQVRSASVRVAAEATLLLISRENFETILNDSPKLGIRLLQILARTLSFRLRETTARFANAIF
ncbi:MAG: cyclic nucleotide-binding domain-containing protein, partial [bacterium]